MIVLLSRPIQDTTTAAAIPDEQAGYQLGARAGIGAVGVHRYGGQRCRVGGLAVCGPRVWRVAGRRSPVEYDAEFVVRCPLSAVPAPA
ncbi:hypothetical protein PV350_18900, partial [Streptomyces sp. PA03-6a]|nr:hypothetical protein [Streptomyces sp. PA03-6a]